MRVVWSDDAVADLRAISEYIERDRSLATANKIVRRIYRDVQGLATMPHGGRPGRVEGTRELVLAPLPYIVIYRIFPERLLVLSVVHGAQMWPKTPLL